MQSGAPDPWERQRRYSANSSEDVWWRVMRMPLGIALGRGVASFPSLERYSGLRVHALEQVCGRRRVLALQVHVGKLALGPFGALVLACIVMTPKRYQYGTHSRHLVPKKLLSEHNQMKHHQTCKRSRSTQLLFIEKPSSSLKNRTFVAGFIQLSM